MRSATIGGVAYDEALARRIREQLTELSDITEKRIFGGLAFLVDGKMALAAGSQGGLMVRADPDRAEQLVDSTAAEPTTMKGRPMKAWLSVPAEAVSGDEDLAGWVDEAVAHTRSLPPKPRG